MIREFNYTQRQRLAAERIQIELTAAPEDEPSSFNAELNLAGLGLPPAAPVMIEAYRRNAAMRFPWGTAGALQPPDNRELSAVDSPPNFRVMILSPDDSRRILALNNRIRPQWDQESDAGIMRLIYLSAKDDLLQEVWRLDLGKTGDVPVLKVNRSIDGISQAVQREPAFRALVFPEVVRSILTHALITQEEDPTNEEGYWYRWFGFVSQFYPEECPAAAGYDMDAEKRQADLRDWIDGAVQAFTDSRFPARKTYADFLSGGIPYGG